MTGRIDADLARWEAGELTLDDLRRLHPGEDVAGLTSLHQQLSALAAEPAPDPAVAWAALATQLADAPVTALHRRRRPRRAVLAAIIASALAVPTVSYAAAPDAVRSIVREVRDLLPGGTDDDPVLNKPGATDAPPATAVVPDDTAPRASTGAPSLLSPGSPTVEPTDADDSSDDQPSDIEAPDEEPDDTESLPDDQPQTEDPTESSDDGPDTETDSVTDTETDDLPEEDEAEPDGDASGAAAPDELDDVVGAASDEVTDD